MFVKGIGRRSVGTALQTSAFTNMSSTYQELNFVPSYPALPYRESLIISHTVYRVSREGQVVNIPVGHHIVQIPTVGGTFVSWKGITVA